VPVYYPILLLLVVAWGAFAFGAVYEWAYVPLLWACAAVGLLGLAGPRAEGRRPINWPVAGALLLLTLGVAAQLVPLLPESIARVSPATDALLRKRDVAYALAASAPGVPFRHPLSIDPRGTWLGLSCLVAFGALMLGTARALGRRSLEFLAAALAAVGLLLALTGIVQSGLGIRDPEATGLIYGFWKPIWGTNPFGPFVNRNHFAGWMLMALPVVLGYFVALVSRGMRGAGPTLRHRLLWFSSPAASRVILVGLSAAVMAVSLVLTFSRSGILGFMLSLAVSAAFVLRSAAGSRAGATAGVAGRVVGSRRTIAIGYLVLVAALAIGWAGIDAVAARFAAAEGTRLNGRLPLWEDTVRVIRDFPVFGTGLNTFGTAMLVYQVWDPTTRTVEAHNDYLQFAAEGGILLTLPALLALVLLAREIRRRFREDRAEGWEAAASGQRESGGRGEPGRRENSGRGESPGRREGPERGGAMSYWLRVGATTGLLAIGLQETVEFSLQMPGNAALFAVLAGIALHRR